MNTAAAPREATNVVSLDQYRSQRLARNASAVSPEVGEIAPFMFVWMPFWYVPVMVPAVYGQEQK